jgi:hypothetical protein
MIMNAEQAFKALGGRKFFGFSVAGSLLTVVSVYAPNGLSTELASAIAALYAIFVGGNVVNTVRAPIGTQPSVEAPRSEPPSVDLTSVYGELDAVREQLASQKAETEKAITTIVSHIENLGKKVQAAITLSTPRKGA